MSRRGQDNGELEEMWARRLARIQQTLREVQAGVEAALAKQDEAEARLIDVQARLAALLAEAEAVGRKGLH